jgi:hypothetical protein
MTPPIPDAILLIIKIFALVGLFLYAIFAFVLVRQEQLMAHVLEESFEPIIRIMAIGHLIVALGIFILALFLL